MFVRLLFLPNFLYFRKSVVKKLRVLRKSNKTMLRIKALIGSCRNLSQYEFQSLAPNLAKDL